MGKYSVVGIFCEDIREEKNGQETIIGILPDRINLQTAPALIPKLCLYVRLHAPPDLDPDTPITVRLTDSEGKVLFENPIAAELIKSMVEKRTGSGHPYLGLIQKVAMSPFNVTKEGRLVAEIQIGEEKQVCGSLQLRLAQRTAISSTTGSSLPA